jgi:hypothetical protein
MPINETTQAKAIAQTADGWCRSACPVDGRLGLVRRLCGGAADLVGMEMDVVALLAIVWLPPAKKWRHRFRLRKLSSWLSRRRRR